MQTLFESTCAQSVLLYVPLPQNGCSKDDLTVLDMLAAGMSEGEAINDFFLDKMNANFECSQQFQIMYQIKNGLRHTVPGCKNGTNLLRLPSKKITNLFGLSPRSQSVVVGSAQWVFI